MDDKAFVARLLPHLTAEMTNELRSADVFAFAGCSYVGHGDDIREVMAHFMTHVCEVHRIATPTPELRILATVAVRELPGRAH